MKDAKEAWDSWIGEQLPESMVAKKLTDEERDEFMGIVNDIPSIKQMPLTSTEMDEVGQLG